MKTNRALKKAIALMLSALLLTLCGCKSNESGSSTAQPSDGTGAVIDTETGDTKEIPWLTMVVDSPVIPSLFVSQFLASVPGYGTEFQVEYELINPLNMTVEDDDGKPAEDPEVRLRRMRTEMMAGKGPDIFLCDCVSAAVWETEDGQPFCEPTFNYPEQAMRNNLFLPLDGYIAGAEHMEWDKMNPAVMAAGSYGGKQLILPIKYQFNVTCFDPETVSGELAQEYSALPTMEYTLNPDADYTDMLSYFGQPADYNNDIPSFTEDELLDLALSGFGTAQKTRDGYFAGLLEAGNNAFLSGPVNQFLFNNASPNELPAYTMLPSYNRDGGVTASISCFAAVNINTAYPDEAFKVLDRMLSEDVQQNFYLTNSVSGVSVYDELGTVDKRNGPSGWWMSDANYESFCAVREQINAVRFYSLLDRETMFTLGNACLAEDATEDSVKAAAHKAFTTMKMMLAES